MRRVFVLIELSSELSLAQHSLEEYITRTSALSQLFPRVVTIKSLVRKQVFRVQQHDCQVQYQWDRFHSFVTGHDCSVSHCACVSVALLTADYVIEALTSNSWLNSLPAVNSYNNKLLREDYEGCKKPKVK